MIVVPAGFLPAAVAVLFTLPVSTSAWLIVYVAVQVVVAPGARVVVGQLAPVILASLITTPVIVWAPVLVTRNE